MKKILLFSFAVLAFAASCQKPQNDLFEPDPLDDGTPVKVMLGTNVLNATAKGSGPLEQFDNTVLSVFAIDHASTNWTSGDPFLLKNYSVTATGGSSASSFETDKYYFETDKYYKDNVNYDFYGYYVDNIDHQETNLKIDAQAVTLPVTITGYEDILLATTDKGKDYKAAKDKAQDEGKTFNENRVYSAYSARRDVVPNLVFKHMLTRLDFVFKTGEDVNSNTRVEIVGIAVKSVINGTLIVAGDQDLVPATEAETALNLRYPTETNFLEMPNTKDGVAIFGSNSNSIMVYPKAGSYELTVKVRQSKKIGADWTPGSVETRTFPIALTSGSFKAGNKYEVTVITYGLEPVVVGVELTDWALGDNTIIDSDK